MPNQSCLQPRIKKAMGTDEYRHRGCRELQASRVLGSRSSLWKETLFLSPKHAGARCPGHADEHTRTHSVQAVISPHRDRVGSEQNQTVFVELNRLWSPRVAGPKGLNPLV